ncbi:MAG: hypothetical protein AVDCRST_MAG40-810 [uncultured Gemmatimonadaceae bacterium]|uniref:Uncharacterized protein n=1 Tax=uncultured Gemmatimonadaceae bacterium TaxID=246130 RepID=A0A6J4KKE8_9BACT|nr:MAG: hypothetical protein AVDCRST_MAG40-810 [uncultured Gemmatimonadaceae bacterium]
MGGAPGARSARGGIAATSTFGPAYTVVTRAGAMPKSSRNDRRARSLNVKIAAAAAYTARSRSITARCSTGDSAAAHEWASCVAMLVFESQYRKYGASVRGAKVAPYCSTASGRADAPARAALRERRSNGSRFR